MADWERRTHALVGALREKGMMNTDELRRGIEALPAATYESLSYYERWASAIESLLVEQRVLTVEEIDERVRTVDRRWG